MLQNVFIFTTANQHAGEVNHATWEFLISRIMKMNDMLNLI